MMEIIPAIDLRGGRVVRLRQGDYMRETRYANDPLALAQAFADAGARWLHVVDLDGARIGAPLCRDILESLTRTGLRVQAGGGVRSEGHVRALFEAGATRVVVGSLAVRAPALVEGWIARYGAERIVVALDTRFDGIAWRLPVSGWTQMLAATLRELALQYARAGLRHLLCTDIERDGMLSGPNRLLSAWLARALPKVAVQASGGVRDAADLIGLRKTGATAAILGRSLLEGGLTLAEALTC